MATVLHSFTIKDAKSKGGGRLRNTQSVAWRHTLGAATLAQLTAYNLAAQAVLDDVTEGQIMAATITVENALLVGRKLAPLADSDVQEGGALAFNLTGMPFTDSVRIPAYLQSLVGLDGRTIDDVGATGLMVAFLLNGDPAAAFAATNQYGIPYLSFNSGGKSFRK